MKDAILFLVELVNMMHDVLIVILNDVLGLQLTDKDMHFWIMGIIGMGTFGIVYLMTKWLARFPYGMHMISFVYTLTFMFVLVFAIEIQQAITNRGNMEFIDAIIGLWGYIAMFFVYALIALFFVLTRFLYKRIKTKRDMEM
ncbi:hypothetical protein [Bacillus weihaiensis]|uniref:Uncharacterized protein n=1 Tax=Bacillus weihaiensis TaxID=1547283 RepID=A0A1L3MMI9_9BACI|nr:hypothetical protein [Bacillus weihaiensis]APH03546.1 hypothetical protein A9C19_01585 [Bacillus weihaiensis]